MFLGGHDDSQNPESGKLAFPVFKAKTWDEVGIIVRSIKVVIRHSLVGRTMVSVVKTGSDTFQITDQPDTFLSREEIRQLIAVGTNVSIFKNWVHFSVKHFGQQMVG